MRHRKTLPINLVLSRMPYRLLWWNLYANYRDRAPASYRLHLNKESRDEPVAPSVKKSSRKMLESYQQDYIRWAVSRQLDQLEDINRKDPERALRLLDGGRIGRILPSRISKTDKIHSDAEVFEQIYLRGVEPLELARRYRRGLWKPTNDDAYDDEMKKNRLSKRFREQFQIKADRFLDALVWACLGEAALGIIDRAKLRRVTTYQELQRFALGRIRKNLMLAKTHPKRYQHHYHQPPPKSAFDELINAHWRVLALAHNKADWITLLANPRLPIKNTIRPHTLPTA